MKTILQNSFLILLASIMFISCSLDRPKKLFRGLKNIITEVEKAGEEPTQNLTEETTPQNEPQQITDNQNNRQTQPQRSTTQNQRQPQKTTQRINHSNYQQRSSNQQHSSNTSIQSAPPRKVINYQKNTAKVKKINGFYIFTDCTPLTNYEVIGEISTRGLDDPDIIATMGQYKAVRDCLIRKARLANYTANGLIMNFTSGGTDKATIIKINESANNKDLASVNKRQGYYIFADSEPATQHDFIGSVQSVFNIMGSEYTPVRDNLIRKSRKKIAGGNGIILSFSTGGADVADVVTFN